MEIKEEMSTGGIAPAATNQIGDGNGPVQLISPLLMKTKKHAAIIKRTVKGKK